MDHTTESFRRYLDPQVLARIGGLDLRARLLVRGFLSGMHRSPSHGFSVEFAEHRKYAQGDDLRFLDWKVYGRTDKHYIKEYEMESNLQLLLAVDCSESMGYRSAESAWSKFDYATTLAASISYLALRQADSVSLATFDSKTHRTSRGSNNPAKWKSIVHELAAATTVGRTSFRHALDELAESTHERHLIVIISDFLGPIEEIAAGLKHMRYRRHEPLVMQVLDRAEMTFPFKTPTRLVGLEEKDVMRVEPRVMREAYLTALRSFMTELRRRCHDQQADYAAFDTSNAVGGALGTYLAARASRVRR